MDLVEAMVEEGQDSVLEETWGSDFGEALPLGLMSVGEGEDCQDADISLVE